MSQTIGVEDACNTDINAVLAVEAIRQRLRDTLAFIVTRAGPNWVYVTPATEALVRCGQQN